MKLLSLVITLLLPGYLKAKDIPYCNTELYKYESEIRRLHKEVRKLERYLNYYTNIAKTDNKTLVTKPKTTSYNYLDGL